jgi:hypothetical protein
MPRFSLSNTVAIGIGKNDNNPAWKHPFEASSLRCFISPKAAPVAETFAALHDDRAEIPRNQFSPALLPRRPILYSFV